MKFVVYGTIYNDFNIEVEAKTEDEAVMKIENMSNEEILKKGEVTQITGDTLEALQKADEDKPKSVVEK